MFFQAIAHYDNTPTQHLSLNALQLAKQFEV